MSYILNPFIFSWKFKNTLSAGSWQPKDIRGTGLFWPQTLKCNNYTYLSSYL